MQQINMTKHTDNCIKWIKNWFEKNGPDCNAVIGISGGLDSSVVAALCVEALGKDRVIGIMMPEGRQDDIQDARDLIEHLGIKSYCLNIRNAVDAIYDEMYMAYIEPKRQAMINCPARVRMTTLYAVSQSMNGRVANTCNLSEEWVGYSTIWGDSVGDFAPIVMFTKTEIKEMAKLLGLPQHLVNKVPADGLTDKTDEENFGFTYEVLDKYIRTGICENTSIKEKIDKMFEQSRFKRTSVHIAKYFDVDFINTFDKRIKNNKGGE